MTLYGRIDSVYTKAPGTTVDVTLVGNGALTALVVESVGEFSELGGSFVHQESGGVYPYTAIDPLTNTITLASGLASGTTLASGDTLLTYPVGADLYADVYLQDVDSESAIPMKVRQGLRTGMAEGTRDGLTDGEVVEVEEIAPGQFIVKDVVSTDPQLQGDYIPPGFVTQADVGSDGIPPAGVTGLSAIPGKGFVMLKWLPVTTNNAGSTQTDLIHYNVYASTDPGFTLDATTKIGETYGTIFVAKELTDGTDFAYVDPATGSPVNYSFAVQPVDADGVGTEAVATGAMSQIGTGDLVIGSITAAMLESVMVLGTTMTTRSQDVDGNLVGPGITLSPDALVAYDASGEATLEIRPNASPSAVFRGDAEIDNLTVNTLTTLVSSQLAQGSAFTLMTGVANPTQAPTATGNTYATVLQFTADGKWPNRTGMTRDASGNIWTARNVGGSKGHYAEMWTSAGVLSLSRQVTTIADVYASVYIPDATNPGLLTLDYVATSQTWYVNSKADTGATTTYPVIGLQNMGTAQGRIPAVGYDSATGEVIFVQSQNTGFVKIWRKSYNSIRTGDANLGTAVVTSATAHPNNFLSVLYGSFDFGSARYVLLAGSSVSDTIVLNGSADDNNFSWPVAPQGSSSPVGMTWDGTVFRTMSTAGKLQNYHGGGNAFSGTSSTKTYYAAYSWTNGATESLISPATSFTLNRRARAFVTTSTLPSGVTGTNIYLSTSSPSKTTASTTLQGAGSGTPPSRSVTALTTTPLNNPIASGFGSSTPAQINFGAGYLKGDGSWSIPGLGTNVAGGTTTTLYDSGWQEISAASGYTKVYAQWRRQGNMVELRFSVTNNSAVSYATNGNVVGDPPILAALPSNLWPTRTVYITSSMSARLGLTYIDTTSGITAIAAVDGYGTASTLAAGSAINGHVNWSI